MVSGRFDLFPHSTPQNPLLVHSPVHRKQPSQVSHLWQDSLYLEAKYEMFGNLSYSPDCASWLAQVALLAPPLPAPGAELAECAAFGGLGQLLCSSSFNEVLLWFH